MKRILPDWRNWWNDIRSPICRRRGHTRMLEERRHSQRRRRLLEAIRHWPSPLRQRAPNLTPDGRRVLKAIPVHPSGCRGLLLDDESAAAMRACIIAAQRDTAPGNEGLWKAGCRLHRTALRDRMVHELLRGMAVRLLFDERLPVEEAAARLMSPFHRRRPRASAPRIEGFLNQRAVLHDAHGAGVLANWLTA